MTRNNKGFSLVELIVAIAIFAIAGVALVSFMQTSSNSYTKSNRDINMQSEQQLAVNRLRDMIIDSSNGIYYGSKTLTVYGAKKVVGGNEKYPVTVIKLDSTNNKLMFGTADFDTVSETTTVDDDQLKLLAEHVTEFDVDLSKAVKEKKVTFQLKFNMNGSEKVITETVALRNRVVVSNKEDEIWGKEAALLNSFIEKITISRGMTEFTAGSTDEIATEGRDIVLVYNADIQSNEVSKREYAVQWSLENITYPALYVPVDGEISVDNTGRVSVKSGVPNDTTFDLVASSVDDPTKYARIQVKVVNDAVYAESMTLKDPIALAEPDGNGYRTYQLEPELKYDDPTVVPNQTDPKYFIWTITTTPMDEEENAGTEEGTEEEVANPENPDEATIVPGTVLLPEGGSFDPATGKLILKTNANNREITITALAKEKTYEGKDITATLTLKPTDIPEYEEETVLRITAPEQLNRGDFIEASLTIDNNRDNKQYEYQWNLDTYYEGGSAQWETIPNSDFDYVSFSEETVYSEMEEDKHERLVIYAEDGTIDNTINIVSASRIHWNYDFKIKLSAVATSVETEEGVEPKTLYAEKIITIPAAHIVLHETTNGMDGVDLLYPNVITGNILQYEDWLYVGNKEELKTEQQKKQYATSRRWFDITFTGLKLTEEEWLECSVSQGFLFRNQVFVPLNNKIVQNPTQHLLQGKKLCGFTANLYSWEKLANRPVYLNYTITVQDKHGNARTSDPHQFYLVYVLKPELTNGGN